MFQAQLINQVVDWERRLEIEEQGRKSRRFDDVFSTPPSNSEVLKIELQPLFKRISKRLEDRQPACPACAPQRLPGA